MTGNDVQVGDVVTMRTPGSWIDGREGTVIALDVEASDGICGHAVQVSSGYTVTEPDTLTVANRQTAWAVQPPGDA